MVPFKILDITEYVNGTIHVEYETIADDGLTLVEGDVFTPTGTTDLEEEVTAWLNEKKTKRTEINARPKPEVTKPRVKRTTAVLSPEALSRVRSRVEE